MSVSAAEVLEKLPCRLGHVALVRVAGDGESDAAFEVVAESPAWFEDVFGGVGGMETHSPFLGDFLEHRAGDHWNSGESEPLSSGYWEESDNHFYEAHAWNLAGGQVLLLSAVDEQARNQQQLIQRNHEQVLDRRQLIKEIEKKEILLDCIVHDLSGPVGTLIMNLEYIGRTLSDQSSLQPAVTRALNQAQRQLTMIRSISHLFAGDISTDDGDAEVREGVDIVGVAHEMTDLHRSTSGDIRLQFRMVRADPTDRLLVAGREAHISRVIENLLLNSIRHTPATGEISITVEALDETAGRQVEVRVEDSGPGVEPSLVEDLFRPFSQGGGQTGQSGLGLYFCRIAVEQYGGSIGYRDPDESGAKGACFWFRLNRAAGAGTDAGDDAASQSSVSS